MTNLNFCTKDVYVNIKYLGDYLGFEDSKEIHTTIHDFKCHWGATIYDTIDKIDMDVKHNRTTFYINYSIPLEELNDTEVRMMILKHNCFLTEVSLEGSLLIDSDHYEVDFEPTFEDGMLKPFDLEILVDQHYIHII